MTANRSHAHASDASAFANTVAMSTSLCMAYLITKRNHLSDARVSNESDSSVRQYRVDLTQESFMKLMATGAHIEEVTSLTYIDTAGWSISLPYDVESQTLGLTPILTVIRLLKICGGEPDRKTISEQSPGHGLRSRNSMGAHGPSMS